MLIVELLFVLVLSEMWCCVACCRLYELACVIVARIYPARLCTRMLRNIGYCAMRPTVTETIGFVANYATATCVVMTMICPTTILELAISCSCAAPDTERVALCCN